MSKTKKARKGKGRRARKAKRNPFFAPEALQYVSYFANPPGAELFDGESDVLYNPPGMGDENMRELERQAALGEPGAAERLERARQRAGIPSSSQPRYVVDLIEEAGLRERVSRAEVAKALKEVFKQAGAKKISVKAPNYSMAASIDVSGPKGTSIAEDEARILRTVVVNESFQNTNQVGLYVWNREDRSRLQEDYFDPGGPMIAPQWQVPFKLALAKAAGQEIQAAQPEGGFTVGQVVRFKKKGQRRRYVVAEIPPRMRNGKQLYTLIALGGAESGSGPFETEGENVVLDADQNVEFYGANEHRQRHKYERYTSPDRAEYWRAIQEGGRLAASVLFPAKRPAPPVEPIMEPITPPAGALPDVVQSMDPTPIAVPPVTIWKEGLTTKVKVSRDRNPRQWEVVMQTLHRLGIRPQTTFAADVIAAGDVDPSELWFQLVGAGLEGADATSPEYGRLYLQNPFFAPEALQYVSYFANPPARGYHVVAINERTGRKVYMTSQPLTHDEACVMLRKIGKDPRRRVQLEEVETNPPGYEQVAELTARSNPKGPYPFAFKTEHYAGYEPAQLEWALRDAAEARDSMRQHDADAEAYYADDVHTIFGELKRRGLRNPDDRRRRLDRDQTGGWTPITRRAAEAIRAGDRDAYLAAEEDASAFLTYGEPHETVELSLAWPEWPRDPQSGMPLALNPGRYGPSVHDVQQAAFAREAARRQAIDSGRGDPYGPRLEVARVLKPTSRHRGDYYVERVERDEDRGHVISRMPVSPLFREHHEAQRWLAERGHDQHLLEPGYVYTSTLQKLDAVSNPAPPGWHDQWRHLREELKEREEDWGRGVALYGPWIDRDDPPEERQARRLLMDRHKPDPLLDGRRHREWLASRRKRGRSNPPGGDLPQRIANTFVAALQATPLKPRWKGDRVPQLDVNLHQTGHGPVVIEVRADGRLAESFGASVHGLVPHQYGTGNHPSVTRAIKKAVAAAKKVR